MKKAFFTALAFGVTQAFAQQALLIPDTLSGTNINLNMHPDSVQFLPGHITHTNAFNSNHYLGPTLILQSGSLMNMHVHNQLGDTSTLHWHGLHVPPMMDGGPQTMIMDSAVWNPQFTVMNKAATYWYHPHFMGKTAFQVMKGAAGMIIVKDADEAALILPRKYGVDDIPLIIQSQQLDSLNEIMHRGMVDSVLLVNGTFKPYVALPAQVVRLRLLNASGERNFNFGFSGNKTFYVIGNDGGLLASPVQTTRIRLSPGERAEVLINLSGMTGQSLYLMSYASELPMGVQGGPTMPMPPGSPPMNSSINGIDFNILKINVTAATANPVTTIPASLVAQTPYAPTSANLTRTIHITADNPMVMDGPFYFNGNSYDMMRIDYRIPLNNTEIWELTNQTMVAHPFHIHDVQFYILDRDGNPPAAVEKGRKDIVLVQPNETVRFITRFEDFTDTVVPYMYHCHVLMHEDDGMMGQFLVVPANPNGVSSPEQVNGEVSVYPNPSGGQLNIKLAADVTAKGGDAIVTVYDITGSKVYSTQLKNGKLVIPTDSWTEGYYMVVVSGENIHFVQKVLIQK